MGVPEQSVAFLLEGSVVHLVMGNLSFEYNLMRLFLCKYSINLGVRTHLLSGSECDPGIGISVDNQCGPCSK